VNPISLLTFCGIAVSAMLHIVITIQGAQAPTPKAPPPLIVGTWMLNPEKSGVRLPPGSMEIRQYTLRPDGFLVGLLITGNAQAGFHYLQFTAKSDGQDYAEYTDNLLAELLATGKETMRTYSERIIDDYVTEWTDKVNGRITGQGKKTISRDGKTLTVSVDGSSAQGRVYDRQ
jgi:hypothetical protein